MKKHSIRKTWVPGEESALYDIRIGDLTLRVVETAGQPMTLDDDAFAEAVARIESRPDRVSAAVGIGDIASDGVRDYILAALATELGDEDVRDILIAANLSGFRRLSGLSQSDLSERSGVKLSTIQALESGVNRVLGAKLETILAIVNALGIGLDDLLAIE